VFWRRYVLGESEEKAMSRGTNSTLEMYVRCYFEMDIGRLRLAILRLRREIGKALGIDKIVGWLSKLMR
jgi:hypothetical protein